MRDKMERLVLLPFAVGCMSESSVGVASPPTRASRAPIPQSSPKRNGETVREESDEETSSEEGKISADLATLPKPNISTGIHRMFKGFKNFSHLFVYKEGLEEEEMEIQIGLPTDVKHVTHIGWDGCMANSDQPMKGRPSWGSYFIDPQLIQDNNLFQRITSPLVPTVSSALEQLESWPGRSRKDIQTANPETRFDPFAVSLKG